MATNCEYVHAAVGINGRWYEASESRKHFGPLDRMRYANRRCAVYTLPPRSGSDWDSWLQAMHRREYDWEGVFLWMFKHQGNPEKFYCHEAAKSAAAVCDITVPEHPVSGCHIANALDCAGIRPRVGKFGIIV
ncbi:MAG: hypothetical protein R3F02_18615 [Thiolinea sp.]